MSSQSPQKNSVAKVVVYCSDPRAAALKEARRIKDDLRRRCALSGVDGYGRKEFKTTGEGMPTVTFRQAQDRAALLAKRAWRKEQSDDRVQRPQRMVQNGQFKCRRSGHHRQIGG